MFQPKRSRKSSDPLSEQEAKEKLLRSMGRHALSSAQAAGKLREWGISGDIARGIITALVSSRLLDDRNYACQFSLSRARRGYGWRRIRSELEQRGLPTPAIESARNLLQEVEDDTGTERLQRMAEQEWKKLAGIEPEARKRRWFGRLYRRGYSTEELTQILRTLMRQEDRDAGRSQTE